MFAIQQQQQNFEFASQQCILFLQKWICYFQIKKKRGTIMIHPVNDHRKFLAVAKR